LTAVTISAIPRPIQIIAFYKPKHTQNKIKNDIATCMGDWFPGVDDLLLELVQKSVVFLRVDLLVLLILLLLLAGFLGCRLVGHVVGVGFQ
jgi:hypothetical protein